MGDLERRLVEQFESHEQTAAALLPDDADNETIALQRSTAQYVALKEALIEIGRAIDHLADNRPVDVEHRLDELRELVVSAKPAKRKKKNS
jgi:hypothetical protein